jgi:hypothetical protein
MYSRQRPTPFVLCNPLTLSLNLASIASMPRELPGLYWDEDRQRYFPLSSARRPHVTAQSSSHPHTKPQSVPPANRDSHNCKRHKIRALLRASEDARSSLHTGHKNKLMQYVPSDRYIFYKVLDVTTSDPLWPTARYRAH